jgi:pilus assembly protein FimV
LSSECHALKPAERLPFWRLRRQRLTSAPGVITQYSVKPGQSLSDIASQITGSTDRATREKMSRALFEANPNAFMGHDPSRLKLGSVLNVPAGR